MSGNTNVFEVRVPPTIDRASVEPWREALSRAESADVVVLRGDDRTFCRGLDLQAVLVASEDERGAAVHGFARALLELRRLRRATVAVVRGAVRGGGLGVVAACDVVLSGSTASFSMPEGLFGLTPAIVGPFIAERVGAPALRRLTLTACTVFGGGAARLGLVDEVVNDSAVDGAALRTIRGLGRTASIAAVTKRDTGPTISMVETAAEQTLARLRDPIVVERIRAFVQDGVAPWEASV